MNPCQERVLAQNTLGLSKIPANNLLSEYLSACPLSLKSGGLSSGRVRTFGDRCSSTLVDRVQRWRCLGSHTTTKASSKVESPNLRGRRKKDC